MWLYVGKGGRTDSTIKQLYGLSLSFKATGKHTLPRYCSVGLILTTYPCQNMVPALIDFIKVAGLVLVTDTSEDPAYSERNSVSMPSYRMPTGVDGVLKGNGVLRFNETIDM